ncbi:arginine kinase-like isoform X2 [Hydractinia symbiolongicarpus]|nr:arginine kinase-like isoform X2 [Hydractinia symbiolongicarpus]XP_057305248.1 arginine kinase-like isoform X2 [Hydractinia symbiolongicarpus]
MGHFISKSKSQKMTTTYVTLSEAKKNAKIDPNFDLILDDDLAQNKWPKQLDEHKTKEKQSLMAQTVDQKLFNKLKQLKTEKAGWTIARAINTGVCYPTSFMGCHAGDLESYSVYKELFHPVIEKYHKGYKLDGSMKHVTDMDVSKITIDLSESAKAKIISTRIRCARNIAAFPLNPGASKENRIAIADLMEKVFHDISSSDDPNLQDLGGTFYRHTTMTPEETQQLVDDHFLFRGKDKMQAASGYHQYWPEGRGIFCSKDKTFLLWINEGDHLRIISMEKGGDVKRVFERLARGAKAIEEGLKKITQKEDVFMSDPMLGMVTCCPTNLGTGMRGSVHILVPKLIKSMGFEKIDELARTMNCQARGSTGEHSEVIDRIDVSNWRRLGFPEYVLVQDMITFANKLAEMEDSCANN